MNFNEILPVLKQKKITLRELLQEDPKLTFKTQAGFRKAIRDKNLKVVDLEVISLKCQVPIYFWYDIDAPESEKLKECEEKVMRLERENEILYKQIALLEEKLGPAIAKHKAHG